MSIASSESILQPAHPDRIEFSFVVPIYNDQYLLDAFCAEFGRVMRDYVARLPGAGFELIVVDDGSRVFDRAGMEKLLRDYPFTRCIRLSRNFGQHIAVTCGYRSARGNFVGMLNADMEDPPAEIPRLLDRLRENDCEIVYGLRRKRRGPLSSRITSRLFTLLLNKLTGFDVPLNVATLRVMTRRFVDAYNALTESSRYIPGLEMWLGFPRAYVDIDHRDRNQGRSSYGLTRRLAMAFDSIVSFSDLPLRIVAFAGLVVALVGILLTLALVVAKLLLVDFEAGYASTIAIIIAFSGVQMLVVGVASVYIGRILREVQNRPLYVIRETLFAGDGVSDPSQARPK